MGLGTWIIVGVVVLAIIGLGLQTFFSGVMQGIAKIGDNPLVKGVTGDMKKAIVERLLQSDIVITRTAQ
jgi:hypothetical protein